MADERRRVMLLPDHVMTPEQIDGNPLMDFLFYLFHTVNVLICLFVIGALIWLFSRLGHRPKPPVHRDYNRPGDPPDLLS